MANEDKLKAAYIKMLLSSAMQAEIPTWNEKLCWLFFENPDHDLKKLAIVCLGHVARVAKSLSIESIEKLEILLDSELVGAEATNALEDYEMFSELKR